jgi:hypothetical protein
MNSRGKVSTLTRTVNINLHTFVSLEFNYHDRDLIHEILFTKLWIFLFFWAKRGSTVKFCIFITWLNPESQKKKRSWHILIFDFDILFGIYWKIKIIFQCSNFSQNFYKKYQNQKSKHFFSRVKQKAQRR